ncbi:hypothetical protein [Desulfobulbus sp.]|nr:hypothetical protein [Desulfobulbus sp.]
MALLQATAMEDHSGKAYHHGRKMRSTLFIGKDSGSRYKAAEGAKT